MKKWTVQLMLLLIMAAGIILTSRIVVSKNKMNGTGSYPQKLGLDKMQNSIKLQGMGRHMLDILR
jgi:hypothetical protein